MRVVHRDEPSIERTPQRATRRNASAREHIADDLAADLVALLSSGAEIERRADDGAALGRERVRPGHVAVLVRTHRNAALVRDALDAAGVPAVINGAGSVFGTAAGARLAAAARGDRAADVDRRARARPR